MGLFPSNLVTTCPRKGETGHLGQILCVKSLQLCPTLCYPMDCSPLGSSVHGISQARILGWVAMPPPGDLPNSDLLCLLHWQVGSLPIVPPGDTTGAKYWGCMPATLPVTDSKLLLGKAPGHRVCMSTAAPPCPVQIHFSICVWGNRSSRMLLGFSSLRATRRRRSVGQTPHPQAP